MTWLFQELAVRAEVIEIGRCDFHDAGTGQRCVKRGRSLILRDPLMTHTVRRTLCRDHSDWIESPDPAKGKHDGK